MTKKLKKFRFLLFAGLILLIPATQGYAVPVTLNVFNGGFFDNAEVIIDQNGTPNTIDPGDLLWGVLSNQNIRNAGNDPSGQTGANTWLQGGALGGPAEITGYFLQEVVSVTPNGAPGGGTDLVRLGVASNDPNGIFTPAELAAGAILRLFESNVINYDTTDQGTGLATATDGTPSWLLSDAGGYLDSYVPAAIPALGQPVGEQYGGLNFLNPDSSLFVNNDDPNEILNNIPVDFYYNAEIFRLNTNPGLTLGDDQPFHFGSNDPWVVNPIPEPGTVMLLGLGLLGLGAIGRRKYLK